MASDSEKTTKTTTRAVVWHSAQDSNHAIATLQLIEKDADVRLKLDGQSAADLASFNAYLTQARPISPAGSSDRDAIAATHETIPGVTPAIQRAWNILCTKLAGERDA